MQDEIHRAPFEGLSQGEIAERLSAYEEAKAEAEKARAVYRAGIVEKPQRGKNYIHFVLPEGVLGRGFTFGDDKRGGDVLEVQNGAFIEVDAKGIPVNDELRRLVGSGELDLSGFPSVSG